MIIAEASLSVPSIRVSNLFGDPRQPRVVTFRLGILTVIWMGKKPRSILMNAARGISNDPDWWLENHRSIRVARGRMERHMSRQLRIRERVLRSGLQAEMEEQLSELGRLRGENWKLREAFKILSKEGEA